MAAHFVRTVQAALHSLIAKIHLVRALHSTRDVDAQKQVWKFDILLYWCQKCASRWVSHITQVVPTTIQKLDRPIYIKRWWVHAHGFLLHSFCWIMIVLCTAAHPKSRWNQSHFQYWQTDTFLWWIWVWNGWVDWTVSWLVDYWLKHWPGQTNVLVKRPTLWTVAKEEGGGTEPSTESRYKVWGFSVNGTFHS